MKKILSLALALSLMLSLVPVASAATTEQVAAANNLYQLGLFKGVGTDGQGNPDFALDRAPNRNEAVTMLVRLLGKEAEALNGTWSIPFKDVDEWAKPYVGYAYANRLTTGTSATTYSGTAAVTATQYITFVLRALGYSSDTDFMWDKAWELSDSIGLTSGQYNKETNIFLRGDVAIISLSALQTELRDCDTLLFDQIFGYDPEKPLEQYAIKLLKIGDTYYCYDPFRDNHFERFFVLYVQNGLYFSDEDIRVAYAAAQENTNGEMERIPLCTSWNLTFPIKLALMTEFDSEEFGNPFIKRFGNMYIGKDLAGSINLQAGIEATEWISPSKSFTPMWVEINNIRLYNLRPNGDSYQIQNGIRYVNASSKPMPCLNDIFSVLGIDKDIVIGRFDGMYYIELI